MPISVVDSEGAMSKRDSVDVNQSERAVVGAKPDASNALFQGLETSVKTLGLASLGTLALVAAHHLGRKQYNRNARMTDYVDGVLQTIGYGHHREQKDSHVAGDARFSRQYNNSAESVCNKEVQINHTGGVVQWISGVADLETNEFAVVGIDSDREIVWQTPLPERVHDILIQPAHLERIGQDGAHVAVMGRRPSEKFWILDASSGKIIHSISAQDNRHYYGHACYSLEGDVLYVTENNTQDFSGIIGVYDVASGYQKISEFASHGIGPHEIVMHTDGDTLVIANGGIKTERASREELNIDSMQPSLAYLNRHDGTLLEQITPEHNQMSVRHLAMHDNGTVVIGIQFQGERHLRVPMVLTHQRGEPEFSALQMPQTDSKGWHRFHHYIASIAVDSERNLVCATSPIGGCAAVFDLTTGLMVGETELPDCAGVTTFSMENKAEQLSEQAAPQFLVSDGQGYLSSIRVERLTDINGTINSDDEQGAPWAAEVEKTHQPYAFDNHLNTLMTVTGRLE